MLTCECRRGGGERPDDIKGMILRRVADIRREEL